MSLSSNTAQTRELSELRNYLQWLDEERRKSGRKIADLEQRLAQQGRDLADRDQKIQVLEGYVAGFNERLERIPEQYPNAAGTEQRLQDLEWHLSNMNSQLARLSNPEEEQERRQGEIAQAISELQARLEADQTTLESRLRLEIVSLLDSEELRTLISQQQNHAQTNDEMDQRFIALQERLGDLSRQLRERTTTLAAESQTNLNSLTARFQEQFDAITVENKTRIAGFEAEWQEKFDALPMEQLTSRLAQLENQQEKTDDSLDNLGNAREILPLLDRLEQELALRQAEEDRLSNLIGTQEDRFALLAATLEEFQELNSDLLRRVSESERLLNDLHAGVQDIDTNWKPAMIDTNNRLVPMVDRLASVSNDVLNIEAGLHALIGDQTELHELVDTLNESYRHNQVEITRQLEGWQATLDENKDTIERFTGQWITLSNQYKEARMAVQNFAHWQKQLEQQKREATEMLRVESNLMQSRWDAFLIEIQEKLKNFEIDISQKWRAFELESEQKWSGSRRGEQLWREELSAVDDLIQKLQQDNRNLIWRVQNAQADAIKKWPRLLMEEVEKAVELNPNRRLSLTATSPGGDMSVVDAIEQGLITIDYNDDPDIEN